MRHTHITKSYKCVDFPVENADKKYANAPFLDYILDMLCLRVRFISEEEVPPASADNHAPLLAGL